MAKQRSVWVVEFRPRGSGDTSWEPMPEGVFPLHDNAIAYHDKMERRYSLDRGQFRVVRYDASE